MNVAAILVGVAVALVATWFVLVAMLVIVRPRDVDLRAMSRLIPDVLRLLRDLAADATLSRTIRVRLGLLLAYLALPFDLIPDFVPVLGYVDDAIIAILVLRSVMRRAGSDPLDRHWRGSPAGLEALRRFAGLPPTNQRDEM